MTKKTNMFKRPNRIYPTYRTKWIQATAQVSSAKKKANENSTDSVHNSNCSENVKHYLFDSTLHGLRYVGDSKISLCERCCI